ncbi:MAG: winged helix-turn-helix transcriptional regulator [Planctomycetales bacterium]|nr:winged helix-turn-helix transcriptional regulator [Planctomycetales bacterium]
MATRKSKSKSKAKCCAETPLNLDGVSDGELLARLAKAVAHPARVTILRMLIERDSCVCGEIVGELPLAQSTVSQHLKILKESGLVQGDIDGPKVCYCVNKPMLKMLQTLVAGLK